LNLSPYLVPWEARPFHIDDNMEEPPAKRARRTDSSAMWERNDTSATSSPRPHDDDRDLRHKGSERDDKRRDGDHRRRSTSRDRNDRKRDRSRSPVRSDRDRDRDKNRDRDRVRDTGRDRDREGRSRRDHDRSRSRDRHRGSKGVHNPLSRLLRARRSRGSEHARRKSRSRSPARNGANISTRARSPPRGLRTDRDRPPQRDKAKDEDKRAFSSKPTKPYPETMQIDKKAIANGQKDAVLDEDDEDALLRKMMGFSSFKSTQNTKVPGNNIYGVRKEKKTEYRQYMNRVGGFNRPLSPTR
jgi:U4/U6.U5 tri-snRNP-associated protein 3